LRAGAVYARKGEVIAFAELFDRLAIRLRLVIRTIEDHGSHFETLPNVTALTQEFPWNEPHKEFHSWTVCLARWFSEAGRVFFTNCMRFKEIIEELQKETRIIVEDVSDGCRCPRTEPLTGHLVICPIRIEIRVIQDPRVRFLVDLRGESFWIF